ncbi:MAG: endonuclease/exonuclease/phosphatase family protein [Fermentimonas sp.]|nr:endonuclease/exonuclease/phosphatase family protein [Fermentimonas sp.]
MRTKISCAAFLLLIVITVSAQKNSMTTLNVASFNIRMDTPNDSLDSWKHRKDMVNGLIRFHDFDVFGIQEGFYHQIMDILEPGGYDYVGVGRDDGEDAGEHSAIIFKKGKLLVLDKGDFWLSETPDVPGKGWDATCCNRICSWAKFKDIDSGKEFFLFNVHYDHQGEEARRQSSYLLLNKIREIADGYPVIATGDFNAVPDSEPIQIIMKDGLLSDSFDVTLQPPYGTTGTFSSFRLNSPMQNRIDYVWITKDIIVNKYGVLNDVQYGHFPSDHFPVLVNVSF